jgi:hypothetical protein
MVPDVFSSAPSLVRTSRKSQMYILRVYMGKRVSGSGEMPCGSWQIRGNHGKLQVDPLEHLRGSDFPYYLRFEKVRRTT